MSEDGSQEKEGSQKRENDSEEEMKENFDLLGARLNDTNINEISPNNNRKALDDNRIAFGIPEQGISDSRTILDTRPPATEKDKTSGKKTILRPRIAPVSVD
jgi:hypothetical protein